MNNKTFGIVVGVIIALALAMFAGLYMLGLTSNSSNSFNDGYEYDYDDTSALYQDDTGYNNEYGSDEFYFDEDGADIYYDEDGNAYNDEADVYYDDDGNVYNFDDYEFEDFDYEDNDMPALE